MKCPACSNGLTERRVGGFAVDVCHGGCGGIWFDAFELQRVDEERETAGEALLNVERDERLQIDATRKRDCPRCADIKLKRHLFSPKTRFEVDECPNCGGYWLDHGELTKIREERTRTMRAEQIAVAGSAVSSDVIRYMYQLRTGQRKPGAL